MLGKRNENVTQKAQFIPIARSRSFFSVSPQGSITKRPQKPKVVQELAYMNARKGNMYKKYFMLAFAELNSTYIHILQVRTVYKLLPGVQENVVKW